MLCEVFRWTCFCYCPVLWWLQWGPVGKGATFQGQQHPCPLYSNEEKLRRWHNDLMTNPWDKMWLDHIRMAGSNSSQTIFKARLWRWWSGQKPQMMRPPWPRPDYPALELPNKQWQSFHDDAQSCAPSYCIMPTNHSIRSPSWWWHHSQSGNDTRTLDSLYG